MEGLRAAMSDGGPVVGTFVLIPRVEIVELVAAAEFDAVVLDFEHGPYGIGDVIGLLAAAEAAGVYTLGRVPEATPTWVGRLLDLGIDGIVVPHVGDAEMARHLVTLARFAPEGERGLHPYVRAGSYGQATRYTEGQNARVALLAMIEGTDGLQALDDILGVDGLDGVFIGPVDLSASLGVPGQTDHPDVVKTAEHVLEAADQRGVATAVFAPTPAAATRWLDRGATMVVLSLDIGMAAGSFRDHRRAVGAARFD